MKSTKKRNIIVINFADENFEITRKSCSKSALEYGLADKVIEYSPTDIDENFRSKNSETFSYKRGAGLWLWKPYFILKTLKQMKDGDYLFYTDAGVIFTKPIRHLIDTFENSGQDVMPFMLPLLEQEWTKNETQTAINSGCKKFRDNQYLATYILFRNSERSRLFVLEWLKYMQNPICSHPETITSELNDPSYIEHREDQSVFSILCKKSGLKAFRDPSQYGDRPFEYGWNKTFTDRWGNYTLIKSNYEKSNYPQILLSVRKENPFKKIKKEKIKHFLSHIKLYNTITYQIKNHIFYYLKCLKKE